MIVSQCSSMGIIPTPKLFKPEMVKIPVKNWLTSLIYVFFIDYINTDQSNCIKLLQDMF